MGKFNPWDMETTGGRLDWSALRETVDLAALMTRLYGPAPGRRGARGRRLWWPCPFHDDRNPSFCIEPGSPSYYCFGCAAKGDAIDLLRRADPSLSFPAAVATATGGPVPPCPKLRTPRSGGFGQESAEPTGLPLDDALRLVAVAESALWSSPGAEALAYVRGRGLTDDTIKAARLGFISGVAYPTRSGGTARAAGVVIPWLDGDRLGLAKVRQSDRQPRYAEVFRDPARLSCYPSPATIRAGLPLVIVEGELDALLLGQELSGLANVQTLGSASSKPAGKALSAFLCCPKWFAAHDGDPAGDKAAKELPRAVRVRPPGQYKDWTEAVTLPRYPVNLRRWWGDVLGGNRNPSLYTWPELRSWRWGGVDAEPDVTRCGPLADGLMYV